MEGTFITLYGINNIGKSTQAKMLIERLRSQGYEAEYLKYPIYDLEPSGPYINKVLRSDEQEISEEELQMWYTINRYQFQSELELKLMQGIIVVAEDYTGTGLAWGTAKGASLEWLTSINEYLLKEDVAILMDGERFMQAKEEHHVHETNDALVARCREVHMELARELGWHVISVDGDKQYVHERIWACVMDNLINE